MAQPREVVLVIDDDQDLCELLEEYLSREGFRVETVHNGEEGMERALAGPFRRSASPLFASGIG
jgi:two-component system response regulator CpxR